MLQAKQPDDGMLGRELVDLISRADWFQEARDHRDEIAHHRTDRTGWQCFFTLTFKFRLVQL